MSPQRAARRVAIVSMVVSAGLAAGKITIGLRANSTAVVSDGLESAADVLASGLVLFGLILAAKPPDEQHPYGHGRLETLSGLAVGMMLVVSGTLISFRAVEHAWDKQQAPESFAIWPVIVSIAVKIVMSLSKWRYGKRTRSSALTADAWNDTLDILSGATALTAVLLSLSNPARFATADSIGGSLVGLIVIFVGIRVVHDTALQLMDTMPDADQMDRIRQVAMKVPGARAIEKCYARKTGLRWHVDLHLEVDPEMSVDASHELATAVRIKIKETLEWVADVLIHVEPYQPAPVATKSHGKS